MRVSTAIIGGAVIVAMTAFAGYAGAQYRYPDGAYPGYAYSQSTPPSWSFDPYTSGLGPCPQRGRKDPPCRDTMFPTYGQPSYWPR